jgi:hypothetical protein
LPARGVATVAPHLLPAMDEGQQHDGGADLAVLLCRHCDSDPIGPLAGSSIPANSGGVSWPLGLRRFCKRRAAAAWDENEASRAGCGRTLAGLIRFVQGAVGVSPDPVSTGSSFRGKARPSERSPSGVAAGEAASRANGE